MASPGETEFRSRNLDEVTARIATIFCPHSLSLGRNDAARTEAGFRVSRSGDMPAVELWYSVPVRVEPEAFNDFYLVTSGLSGKAVIRRGRDEVTFHPSVTVPLSASAMHRMEFGADFRQRSVKVSRESLHRLFARWTGRPVEGSLNFHLKPFDRSLGARWDDAMAALYGRDGHAPLPEIGRAMLLEYALALLIESHPHSNGDALAPRRDVVPRQIREARSFIHAHADQPIGLAEIARAAGCSVRTLQAGFRSHLETTPRAYLAAVRLEKAHEELCRAVPGATVAGIAMGLGFSNLGRFSAAFAARYGEQPANLLRARRRPA